MGKYNRSELGGLPDEELLSLYREGSQEARDVLAVRFFRERKVLIEKMLPNVSIVLDEWDLNECFFVSYLKAEERFDVGKKAKFLTYFCTILHKELLNLIRSSTTDDRSIAKFSIDETRNEEKDDISFHELITAYPEDESRAYADLSSLVDMLQTNPDSIPPKAQSLAVFLYYGYPLGTACKNLGISTQTGRRLLNDLKVAIKTWMSEEETKANNYHSSIRSAQSTKRAIETDTNKKPRGRPKGRRKRGRPRKS